MTEKFMVFDTETTNDIDCPIMYDFGFAIIDKNGEGAAEEAPAEAAPAEA